MIQLSGEHCSYISGTSKVIVYKVIDLKHKQYANRVACENLTILWLVQKARQFNIS